MSGPFFSDPKTASLYALNPATVHLVTLPLDRIMIDAGDFSRATTTTAYFDINYDFNDKVHFKNQSFMDWMDHQKFSSYGFGAGLPPVDRREQVHDRLRSEARQMAGGPLARRLQLPESDGQRGRRAQRLPGGGSPRPLDRRDAQRSFRRPLQQQRADHVSVLPERAITATRACSGSPTRCSSTN